MFALARFTPFLLLQARACLCRGLFALCGLLLFHPAQAQPPSLADVTGHPLGRSMGVLHETTQRLTLQQAQHLQRQGQFVQETRAVPKFGIGAQPVWLHLAVMNPSAEPQSRHLLVENTWLDRLDVFHHDSQQRLNTWLAGDGDAARQHPVPGLGYVFELSLAPGLNDVYLRVETADPMMLPVRLLSGAELDAVQHLYNFGYGLLYGCLLALIAYNVMLYLGLRQRSYLDYTLYLGCFVLLHLAYTGHGYALIWPDLPLLQQYVILVLMVIVGGAGLRFASGFLHLREQAPHAYRAVRMFAVSGLALVLAAALLRQQALAAGVAFGFTLLSSLAMVWLGWITVRHGQVGGRYFLLATVFAMLGMTSTNLTVWVGLPYTVFGFHAVGWGMVVEGLLLALALAYRMRQIDRERLSAEQLARLDPLTGLFNRRAFLEQAAPLWSSAERHQQTMTVLLADLDHFKAINDAHGHAVGDQVLVAVSRVLRSGSRSGDVVARWGGEEFILLLPHTDAGHALQLAERLREEVCALRLAPQGRTLQLSVSLGLATCAGHASLESLIAQADSCLYQAKRDGRNRVCGVAPPAQPAPGAHQL